MATGLRITASLTGMADIKDRMRQYTQDISTKVVRSGLNAGVKELAKIAAAAAPYDPSADQPEHIRTNVQSAFSRSRSGAGITVATVGVKYGKAPKTVITKGRNKGKTMRARKTEGSTFYWKFFEGGTRAGKGRGKGLPAKHFMGKSLASNRQRIADLITQTMSKSLDKFAKKNPGKR